MKFYKARIGRLAIQFGAVFALLMCTAGVTIYYLARDRLVENVDRSLDRERERLTRLSGVQQIPDVDLRKRISSLEASRTITDKGHVLFARDGRQVFGRISLSLPPDGYSDVVYHEGNSPRPRGARALVSPLADGSRLVIVSHSEVVEDLNDVLLPLSLALIVTALLGGLLATQLLGRQIAGRLQQIMGAADAISHGNLSSRVPVDRLDGIFKTQAHSFNRMLDRIAQLVAHQRQFSSSLAHELRTPLTRLRGILREGEGEDIPPHVSRILERAERESSSTIRIFDALLRLSEIEAGRHPAAMRPVSLRAVVEDAIETIEPVLADADCELVTGEVADVTVTADADLLVQLLVNALENIALHTPAGTCARVSVMQTDEQAVVRISDNGPGLPQDQLETMLQPFERGPASKSVRGHGLGLTIAHAIVHFHGGDLRLSNNAPGLLVEIELPITPDQGQA
jgi:hypothetical protein